MLVEFILNGRSVRVDGDGARPLLWVLREDLGLPGTRFGCGRGLCGACTVHVDGVAVRSCALPLAGVAGREVTTIEAIADTPMRVVQQAWIEENTPQCGYCQSGQIMSAAALLAHDPAPDDAAIDRAMAGNLCRCGAYPRIRRAIHRAAALLADGQAS